MKRLLSHGSLPALAVTLCLSAFAHSSFAQGTDAQTTEAAQQALSAQIGDGGKDLRVKVTGGDAELSGWAQGPRDVKQAAYIVSKVPGISNAYSGAVHTWTTSDHL